MTNQLENVIENLESMPDRIENVIKSLESMTNPLENASNYRKRTSEQLILTPFPGFEKNSRFIKL